jgi:hypothetical protein
VIVHDLLGFLDGQCRDLVRIQMQLTDEHRDDPRLVFNWSILDGDRPIDLRASANATPKLFLRDLQLVSEDAAETAGTQRLLRRMGDVRLQNAPVGEHLLVEDVPLTLPTVLR